MMTFFFGLLTVLIISMSCSRVSETAGWVALVAVIGFLILVQLSKTTSLNLKAMMNDKCVDEVCSGCDTAADQCNTPKIDPCEKPC